MHKSQSLFYLTTALHVSGVTVTQLQEHKTTVITASGNRYIVLLSAAIVEGLEPVWVCCEWRTPPTAHSNWFQLFHDSSRQQYGVMVTRRYSYSCFVLLKLGDSDARNM
jgi:heme A synthase